MIFVGFGTDLFVPNEIWSLRLLCLKVMLPYKLPPTLILTLHFGGWSLGSNKLNQSFNFLQTRHGTAANCCDKYKLILVLIVIILRSFCRWRCGWRWLLGVPGDRTSVSTPTPRPRWASTKQTRVKNSQPILTFSFNSTLNWMAAESPFSFLNLPETAQK